MSAAATTRGAASLQSSHGDFAIEDKAALLRAEVMTLAQGAVQILISAPLDLGAAAPSNQALNAGYFSVPQQKVHVPNAAVPATMPALAVSFRVVSQQPPRNAVPTYATNDSLRPSASCSHSN